MKCTLKRLLTMTLCLMFLLAIVPLRSADAQVKANKNASGSSKRATVFFVTTESKGKCQIKLSSTKGVMNVMSRPGGGVTYNIYKNSIAENKPNKTRKMYEWYDIKVEKVALPNRILSTKEYTMTDSSLTISLQNNSTYRITVTPRFDWFNAQMKGTYYTRHIQVNPYARKDLGVLRGLIAVVQDTSWLPTGWKTHATWKISSTKGIGAVDVK